MTKKKPKGTENGPSRDVLATEPCRCGGTVEVRAAGSGHPSTPTPFVARCRDCGRWWHKTEARTASEGD